MRLDPAIGGSTTSTVANIVAEQRSGVACTVVFAAGADDDVRTRAVVARLTSEGAEVKRFPRARRPAAASAQFGLSRSAAGWLTANVRLFDIVHAHGPWGAITAWSLIVARRHHVPTVVTARESLTAFDRDTSKSRLRASAKTLAWRAVPALADVVVYTSQLERDSSPVTGRFGSRIIWHAVVDETRPRPVPQPRDARSAHVVAGFLGRLDPKKNLPLLIDAVAAEPRLRLTVAGGGNDSLEAALRARAVALGVDDRVTFLGRIPAEARSNFFAAIDVLALPSSYENFGMAPAEAMEHGVPVLVGERTGLAELLRETGGGATVQLEAEAIAAGIMTLGASARDAAFARDVQSIVVDNLSFAAHAEFALALYTELCSKPLPRKFCVPTSEDSRP